MTCSGTNHLCNSCIVHERKSRLLRWLGKVFKGSNGGNPRSSSVGDREENTVRQSPARSVDDRCRDEDDDLDRAIALSLAEDHKKPGGGLSGHDAGESEEAELARAVQESLNTPLYPPYQPIGYRFCRGCNREIGCGHYYMRCNGFLWHLHCFRCHACGRLIQETQHYALWENKSYHRACFKELFHPRCDVCHEFIPTNSEGVTVYKVHQFWDQKYCPEHDHDGTPRCCSCERLESRRTTYVSLGEGRSLCLECLDSAIMDTGDCQPLYHGIRDFYEGLNMKIDQQIPMLMVERQGLNEAIIGTGREGIRNLPETRGLCLSEERTVSSIMKRPKIGGNRILNMKTSPQKLSRRCEVTAILVLYGLPRLLTGSILAHELMHAYLRLKGYRNLSPEVEEGICQIMSQMWLESEVPLVPRGMPSTSTAASASTKKGRTSEMEGKLGECFMYQIANDTSPHYGGGFREANAAVNKYGLRRTLDHIHLTGHFPL